MMRAHLDCQPGSGEVDDRQGASSDKLIKLTGTSAFTSFIVTNDRRA